MKLRYKNGLLLPVEKPTEEELLQKRRELYDKYSQLHAYCPACGSSSHEQTCIGHIMVSLETHHDTNRSTCLDCGWKGTVHDRVEKFEKKT